MENKITLGKILYTQKSKSQAIFLQSKKIDSTSRSPADSR